MKIQNVTARAIATAPIAVPALTRACARLGLCLIVIAAALLAAPAAHAGPPLVCHPFDIGGAKCLPWEDSARSWEGTSAAYRTDRLADDTVALLAPETPILVRMETLRRAGIYTVKDTRAGEDLLSRLIARTKSNAADARSASLAWFDLGYLIETVKQAEHGPAVPVSTRILEALGLVASDPRLKSIGGLDGYEMVTRALSMRGNDPGMEYAAALITWYPRRPAHEAHLARAAARAEEGSLLAKNMLRSFGNRGGTLAELRQSLAVPER